MTASGHSPSSVDIKSASASEKAKVSEKRIESGRCVFSAVDKTHLVRRLGSTKSEEEEVFATLTEGDKVLPAERGN